ncbi:MAG: hypothetical protein KJ645_06845, partial [Planctomycetes bacterium]|nr:hypothetical protein [Planctomycetota bacterium]
RGTLDLVKALELITEDYNQIVMFKTCYVGSDIDLLGDPPGDPEDTRKSIWNYKAAYLACAEIFARYPEVLFIPVSASPRNRLDGPYNTTRGLFAWQFNEWLAGEFVDTYRHTTGLNNLAVFDWFSNLLAIPASDPDYPGALKAIYSDGSDSHPNSTANQEATELFLPFINYAVKDWRQFVGQRYTFEASQACSVDMYLHGGLKYINRPYVVLGSLTGTYPGTSLPMGVHLCLNWDILTDYTLALANTPWMLHFMGNLDWKGDAVVRLQTPQAFPPEVVGFYMYYSYVVYSPVEFASNVIPLLFVP